MDREGREIQIQPITGEKWDAAWSRVLRAGTKREHGQNLGAGIDGWPDPEHVLGVASPGAQFVQLQVWEPQLAEGTFV